MKALNLIHRWQTLDDPVQCSKKVISCHFVSATLNILSNKAGSVENGYLHFQAFNKVFIL